MSTSYMANPPEGFDTSLGDDDSKLLERLVHLAVEHSRWRRGKDRDGDLALTNGLSWATEPEGIRTPDGRAWLCFERYGMNNLDSLVSSLKDHGWKVMNDWEDEWTNLWLTWYPDESEEDERC